MNKLNTSDTKENFLKVNSIGEEFYFGSNTNGIWEEDGTIWYNSYGCEQFFFDNVEDFLAQWYDNKEVPHEYQSYIGERDFEGNVTLENGSIVPDEGFCKIEDGGEVWSILEKRNS